MAKLLTGAQILKAIARRPYVDVSCPELGGVVRLQALSERERLDLQNGEPGEGVENAAFIAASAVDGKGNRLFTVDQVAELQEMTAGVFNRLLVETFKLNALTAGEAKELEGNGGAESSSASA